MIHGYARVSTDVQSLDAQVDEYNRAQVFTLVFCALKTKRPSVEGRQSRRNDIGLSASQGRGFAVDTRGKIRWRNRRGADKARENAFNQEPLRFERRGEK